MVIMISLIPAARDAAVSISSGNQEYVDALDNIATKLSDIGYCKSGNPQNVEEPPPGI